ncbi:hypothetical protein Tcan_09804 [Toxocara canis]|uniref:Uncharacterized protein n=1 Tax=Toxocara canis TaxID=6265 RepID=A0A0B2VS10_TOXCA|nr:hypothetical protein Tcan_09804 [Toxocara canis]
MVCRFSTLGQCAYIATGTLSPLLLASNCASIWTMCFIAVRRHHAIARPLHSLVSPASNIAPLSTIAICALLFNASKWAEFRWYWYRDPSTKRYLLIHEYSELAHNTLYILVESIHRCDSVYCGCDHGKDGERRKDVYEMNFCTANNLLFSFFLCGNKWSSMENTMGAQNFGSKATKKRLISRTSCWHIA